MKIQIIIIHNYLGNEKVIYKYPIEELTYSQAYEKCINIEVYEPLLPNGTKFSYGCMRATFECIEEI